MTDLETQRALLDEASARLLATVGGLEDEAYAASSALPGWTRAHVVAHLTLNGEGLATALDGVRRGRQVPMYRSDDARDADIADLATAAPAELRERLTASCHAYAAAWDALPEQSRSTRIERVAGSPLTFSAAATLGMRLRETEVHHVDLASAYDRSQWPAVFGEHLVRAMTKRVDGSFRLAATDTGAEWTCGSGEGPRVSGAAVDLGWWLTGRGGEDRLTSEDGDMPGIEEW
jgi:maleylpyruvate isomerase